MSFNDTSRADALKQYFQGNQMNPDSVYKNRAVIQPTALSSNPTTRELLESLESCVDNLGGNLHNLREQLSPALAPSPICGETGVNDEGVYTSQLNYQLINIIKRVIALDSFVDDIKHDIAL